MSPALGIEPLRVGPEDPSSSEAGELVKDLGVGRHAKQLIRMTAKQMPKALRIACSRFEHLQRSKYLSESEVWDITANFLKDEGLELEEVLSARVKGPQHDPASRKTNVVVLYETSEGRTGRVAFAYNTDDFEDSRDSFEGALAAGDVNLSDEGKADLGSLRRHNEQLQAEVKRMAKASKETAGITEDEVQEIVAAATAKAVADALKTVDTTTEEPESTEETAKEEPEATEEPETEEEEPESTLLAEIPDDYKAADIVEHIADFSDELLKTLAKDGRKTVAVAAKAEVKARKA
jgi:hypothetical protein